MQARHGNQTHGLTGTAEHRAWIAMRHRCMNPQNESWAEYGQRGIQVCPRWDSFEAFLLDMGRARPRLILWNETR